MRIPLASSGLRPIDIQAADKVLNSGFLTMGKNVKEFENKMADYLGRKHFVMVNSGSSANLAMLEALLRPSSGIPYLLPGDKVLVPAIAWPTTIWPVLQLGLELEFVDIDEETLAIDLNQAEEKIAKDRSIKAIFIIHPMGRAIDHKSLENLVIKYKIQVINDVCESLGSFIDGKHAGNSGIASSFSFYFSHHLTTMEGGGIATDNGQFANDLRSIRSHGWSRDRTDASEWHKNLQGNDAKFLFVTTGYNIRPMEIQAAIGISQLKDLNFFVEKRRTIAQRVKNSIDKTCLSLIGSDTLSTFEKSKSHSWMLLPIRISPITGRHVKSTVIDFLESVGIETRPVLTGNFLSQPSMQRIGRNLPSPDTFPRATDISESSFLVGAHHDLSDEQINFLCESLKEASRIVAQ
jgi:CDP-6-deoxy-D-xylo-4-hexulose-3-dehydrase